MSSSLVVALALEAIEALEGVLTYKLRKRGSSIISLNIHKISITAIYTIRFPLNILQTKFLSKTDV